MRTAYIHCWRLKHWLNNGRTATLGPVSEKFIQCWQFAKKFEVDKHCPSNHEHLGSTSYPNFFSRLGCCGLMSVKSTARKSSNSCMSIWRHLCSVRVRFSFWTTIAVRRTRQTVVTANTTSCPSRLSSASILAVTDLHANKNSYTSLKYKPTNFRPSDMCVKEFHEWRNLLLKSWTVKHSSRKSN